MNKKQLYRDTLKLVKKTNQRLNQLQRGKDINRGTYNPKTKRFERKNKKVEWVKYPIGTWSTKKLVERIPDSIINGKITTNIENYNRTELLALHKTLSNFLKSETSTFKGIRAKEEEIKRNIALELDDFGEIPLTSGEINTLYDFFTDKDFNYVTSFIPPSDLWKLMIESKARGEDSKGFVKRVSQYIDEDTVYQDLDLKEALISIYSKFNI